MPSTSPGSPRTSPGFNQVLPGAPASSLQCFSNFRFRHKRYVVYISGRQLNILSAPRTFVQAITLEDELVAVAAEFLTGKLVVADRSDAYVLEPVVEGWTKVWWEKSLHLRLGYPSNELQCLSWGSEGEVLVGGSKYLSLFSTLPSSRSGSSESSSGVVKVVEKRAALWSKVVASPLQYAAFSPNAGLIASCSKYDRLVKIWRRLSYEEGLFDHTYLPHGGCVTHLEWRPTEEDMEDRRGSGLNGRHEDGLDVLYTIASDGILRVWRTFSVHELDIISLHTTVDLVSAIPQSPTLTMNGATSSNRPTRFAIFLPSSAFCAAVSAARQRKANSKLSHALEHLREMSSKAPDVIVTLDGHGRMSAWGLQSIGHKRRPETPTAAQPFHIAHAEATALDFPSDANARFQAWFDGTDFHLLAHTFENAVQWLQADVELFFSPSAPGADRITDCVDWTGHSNAVAGMAVSPDGDALLSWSTDCEVVKWEMGQDNHLRQMARFVSQEMVLDALPLPTINHSVVLTATSIKLCRTDGAILAQQTHDLGETPRLYGPFGADGDMVTVFDQEGTAIVLSISHVGADSEPSVASHDRFTLATETPTRLVCVTAPRSRSSAVADRTWNGSDLNFVTIDPLSNLQRLSVCIGKHKLGGTDIQQTLQTFSTGLDDVTATVAYDDTIALVCKKQKTVAIIDLMDGYIEYRQSFEQPIQHVRIKADTDNHKILAIAFRDSVTVLVQGRYEHHHEVEVWRTVKRVSVAELGLPIVCLAWLVSGTGVIAVGNGLLVAKNVTFAQELNVDLREKLNVGEGRQKQLALPELAAQIKRPTPVWHPSLLTQLLHHGKHSAAVLILRTLGERLKFWSEGEHLSSLLGIDASDILDHSSQRNQENLSDDVVQDLTEQLDEKDLPGMSASEQRRLKRVLEALVYVSEHAQGLDMCALRYLFTWRLHLLQMEETQSKPTGVHQPNGVAHDQSPLVPEMHWREIAFVSHSTTQQPLLDILTLHYDHKLTWPIARGLGVTAWLSDKDALAQVFEALAQSTYRQTSPPDPINASLYFLAMHKKATLLALWRIATWHREQRATMNFLKRDFDEPSAKTAARKNAYALMGKRRFEYAAAFFLLADDAASATSLLAGQCEDVMLAIAVARLYAGDQSATLRKLLHDRLMPDAEKKGDRWLMSWCHYILAEKEKAAEALVRPIDGVRSWYQDDSTTLMLYRELRKGSSEHEYQAVLRAARVLRRMGMWLLALELVKNWEFKTSSLPQTAARTPANQIAETNGKHNEPSVRNGEDVSAVSSHSSVMEGLQTASSVVSNDSAARAAKAAELLSKMKAKKEAEATRTWNEKTVQAPPPPTQFQEPDANSLLDSFGF